MKTTPASKNKPSSVRHPRASRRDQQTPPNAALPADQIAARLVDLGHLATPAQVTAYQAMELRERLLSLPVMVGFVLSLIWRQLGSVGEAGRVLPRAGFLWTSPQPGSPHALGPRFQRLHAGSFERLLAPVLLRATTRQRPWSPEVAAARSLSASIGPHLLLLQVSPMPLAMMSH